MNVRADRSKRDRQIWVRLTHDEYEKLRDYADKSGAATLSNCARDAVRRATALLGDAAAASGVSGQGAWTFDALVHKRPRTGAGTRARTSRDYTITVRLTQEEHEKLCVLCMATGARNISDCARQAICEAVGEPVIQDGSIAGRVVTLEHELANVRRDLARVLTLVEAPSPGSADAEGPSETKAAAQGAGGSA